jgi:hypothetical protein
MLALLNNDSVVDFNIGSYEGVHRNKLGVNGVRLLTDVLKKNQTLGFLSVGGNSIGNEGLKVITEGLKGN